MASKLILALALGFGLEPLFVSASIQSEGTCSTALTNAECMDYANSVENDGQHVNFYDDVSVSSLPSGCIMSPIWSGGNVDIVFNTGDAACGAQGFDCICDGDATASATGAICFSGDSLLTLEDGSNIKFQDLKVSQSSRVTRSE